MPLVRNVLQTPVVFENPSHYEINRVETCFPDSSNLSRRKHLWAIFSQDEIDDLLSAINSDDDGSDQ